MDALELIRLRYDAIHGAFVDDLFAGLTDAQIRARPHGLNSLVWLLWHATRGDDSTYPAWAVLAHPEEDGDD